MQEPVKESSPNPPEEQTEQNQEATIQETSQRDIVCRGCAGKLVFAPGTNSMKCPYCGTLNEIAASSEMIEELDFEKFLKEFQEQSTMQEVANIKCDACGAQTTFDPGVVSGSCPFCGTPQVVKKASLNTTFRPRSVLPFMVNLDSAYGGFRQWLKKLWFAPNKLKDSARQDSFTGLYIPYWTYDAKTASDYRGQRGDDYQERQSYTTVENGRTVTRTRMVTKTRWSRRSGHVDCVFNDVLVAASRSLPDKHVRSLEPWHLGKLVPFDESYLSGFRTESYQIDLKEGFALAKQIIDKGIEGAVKKDIGGDRQIIEALRTLYNNITFKHILLPIWISAYRFNNKTYRFLINGCTGEVQGERPYSWVKITLFILTIIAVIAAILLLTRNG
jgi:LSD1 subclass zinc finger protein